jgi:hypothetical protein
MEALPADHHAALLGAEHHLQFRGELFTIEFPGRWRDVAEPAHFLPIHEAVPGPLALVLGPTQTTVSDYLRGLYPDAVFADVTGPNGEPLFFRTAQLSFDELRARSGLAVSARGRDGRTVELGRGDPFAEGLEVPADAEALLWSGSLYWSGDRSLGVTVDADQHTVVTIGDHPPIVAEGGRSKPVNFVLPRGWHPLRIEEHVAPRRRLSIAVASEPLTRWSLRPDAAREGLVATYARTDGVVIQAIDPQLNAFAVEDRFPPHSELLVRMPFTATWRGALRVDTPGDYLFEAQGSGPYAVRLDGTPLLANTPAIPEQPVLARAARTLAPGLHPIEAHFDSTRKAHTTRRLFQLFWTPPGGSKQLIPPTQFVPEPGP